MKKLIVLQLWQLNDSNIILQVIVMKAIFCIFVSIVTMIVPTQSLKNYCKKLADSAYVISQTNEKDQKSTAVRVFSSKQLHNFR